MSRRRGKGARARRGMTLVEVVVAMMLLVSVVLVLGNFSMQFTRAAAQAHLVINANEAASTRLDAVKQQPTYAAIDSLARTDTVVSDFTKYARKTQVAHIGGAVTDSVDYKVITVTVTHPSMQKKVIKSTAVAVF